MGYEAMPEFFSTYICMKTVSLESMRQKLVTLDPTTFETSKQMLNFSAWVREQLVHYRNGHHVRELLEEIQHLEQLIADVIAERKTWVPNRGWVTNDS
jgi:hypothetical protein